MQLSKAYFGAGCFWGVELAFSQLNGVTQTAVGYMNGNTTHPTYKDVCTGLTHHAEVVEVVFHPATISYPQLLWVFWHLHDPTQLNRQGVDVGTQYRSGIYTYGAEQFKQAQASKVKAQALFDSPIVTEIIAAETFWKAEDYHQDYLRKNPWRGACHVLPDLKAVLASFSAGIVD